MNFYAINAAPINGDAGQTYYGESNAHLTLQADANLKQATTASVKANALLTAKAKSGRAIYENGSALLSLLSKNLTHYVRNYNQGKAGLLLNTSGKSSDVYFGFGVCSLSLNSKNTSHYAKALSNLKLDLKAESSLRHNGSGLSEIELKSSGNPVIATTGYGAANIKLVATSSGMLLIYLDGNASFGMKASALGNLVFYEHGLSELILRSKADGKLAIIGSGHNLLQLNSVVGIPNPPIAPIWFNDAHRSARLKQPTENRSFVIPKDRGKMTVTDNQSIRIQRE